MKKCIIVYNPQSGIKSPFKNFKNFDRVFKKYGYETELIETRWRGDATDIVKRIGYADLVLVAGGDGTLNEAIEGNMLRKHKLTIAQLPFGTQNDVAHMYGLTNNILHNLELVLSGVTKNIDVCLLNRRPFVYVACIGSYVDIAYATPRKLKEKYGRLAYILYGIKQIKQTFHQFELEYIINGERHKGNYSFIFVTNSNRVAGSYIYNDVKLNDSKFEVLMVKINNKWDIFRALYYLKRRDMNHLPSFFKYYKTNNFKLIFKDIPSCSWCLDGDEYKHDSREFDFGVTNEIPMQVPKKNINKLFD